MQFLNMQFYSVQHIKYRTYKLYVVFTANNIKIRTHIYSYAFKIIFVLVMKKIMSRAPNAMLSRIFQNHFDGFGHF